jgi:hypothetical protein
MQTKQSEAKAPPLERRKYQRIVIELPGQLSLPTSKEIIDCRVINLSGGGAAVRCETSIPPHKNVVLTVEGFGHFECVTTRYADGELGLRFVCREVRRKRLLADIASFVEESARLRQQQSMPPVSEIRFARPNGEQFRCGIAGASPQGLMLQTNVRPPLGEIVHVGQTYGRVVDHHDGGIAIQFVKAAPGETQFR